MVPYGWAVVSFQDGNSWYSRPYGVPSHIKESWLCNLVDVKEVSGWVLKPGLLWRLLCSLLGHLLWGKASCQVIMPVSCKQPYKESYVARSRDFPLTTGITWSGMWGRHEVWFLLLCSSLRMKLPPPTAWLLPCGTLSQNHPSKSFLNSDPQTPWKVKVAQLTLCDPTDYTVHGILQARILERVAFPFSRGSSQPRDQTQVSRIAGRFFTIWATREAQEYWSG